MYNPPTKGLRVFGESGREMRTTPAIVPECCAGSDDSDTRVQLASASATKTSADPALRISPIQFGRKAREDLVIDRACGSRKVFEVEFGGIAAHGRGRAVGDVDHARIHADASDDR